MRFASSKLQKTIELHARQQGRASMMHPPHCDLQTRSCKTSKNYCTCATTMQNNIDAATPVRFAGCKGQRIVCATTTQNNIDVDTPLGFASTIALCSQVRSFSCPKHAPKPDLSAKTKKLQPWRSWRLWKAQKNIIIKTNLRHLAQPPARPPSKTATWRCCKFVKTTLSCATSFKNRTVKLWKRRFRERPPSKHKLKLWKRNFPARPSWKTASWRCENEAFVRDHLQKLGVEDVKTMFFCETSFQTCNLKLRKRSLNRQFHCRTNSTWSEHDPNIAQDRLAPAARQTFPIHLLHILSCKGYNSLRLLSLKHVLQKPQPDNVKTKLSCETSFKNCKLTLWKQRFRAKPPSRTGSWSCANEVFVRDFLQKLQVEVVQTTLLCENSFKNCKLKLWKRRFRARPPLKFLRGFPSKTATVVDVGKQRFRAGPPSKLQLELAKTKLSRKTSFKNWKLKLWKRSFRARLPSKTASWSCANDASVRELLQKLQVEVVKTTLPCETSFKISSRLSFKNCYRSWRRETTLSCGTSFKTATWTCENEAFAQNLLQELEVEVVKTKFSCETSFETCNLFCTFLFFAPLPFFALCFALLFPLLCSLHFFALWPLCSCVLFTLLCSLLFFALCSSLPLLVFALCSSLIFAVQNSVTRKYSGIASKFPLTDDIQWIEL